MPTANNIVWTNELLEASNLSIVDGVPMDALVSASINNSSGNLFNSLKCTINYSNLTPDVPGVNWQIGAVIEGLDANSNWYPIAYQFTPLKNKAQGLQRILYLQPNMDTVNVGIDDIVYPVDSITARISREQGIVPETAIRVKIILLEKDQNAATAFSSVTINAEVELYNV